ncbi:pyridoxamine 5'-phosphate oxidase family protein [Desulfovibrio mangrovi]|uniref:pyridoxamine 5'-phosphate oxidase family protein n=1 Tax=Desulfovibrio mangrovi TaxID=2976983 RepID=UPI00224632E0|nr:pyridoxamine 5'-phosphate oxidase family protein [Desulfovibrio mangrovi]UZP68518.1 pyridoxamine 5'-phosphate oxidase family protein [Desulfovibrio mangrovi]
MLERMQAILRENDICVLATTDSCKPHTSLMTYFCAEDAESLYMLTRRNTRKFENILKNPNVSILIDTRLQHCGSSHDKTCALTVAGTANVLDGPEHKDIILKLLNKNKELNTLTDAGDTAILHISITSLQLLEGVANSHLKQM